MDSPKPAETPLDPAALAEKARKKELHRKSMIWTGGMIAFSALAAAWVRWLPLPLITIRGSSDARQTPAPARPMLVRWSDFSRETLARARRDDRLILLSLAASWSAPSRRMDGEAFADEAVAGMLDRELAAVRVDADARPDLALRYLGAGWPTTAVLLPGGEILDSGTYMTGPVLRSWAGTLNAKFREHRAAVARAAEDAVKRRAGETQAAAGQPEAALDKAHAALAATWLSAAPLFPRFDRLLSLSRLRADWAAGLAKEGLERALTLQAPDGGLRRDIGRDGIAEPVFLLGDQADALAFLSRARPDAAARLRGFVETTLEDSKGGFRQASYADGGAARADGRAFCDENGRMAAALLQDPEASAAQKAAARRAVDLLWARRRGGLAVRQAGGPEGLLGDQLGLIEALLAAGRIADAEALAAKAEGALLDERGQALYDRPARMELSEGLDRIRVGALNARARRDWLALAKAQGPETATGRKRRARAQALGDWLWTHPEGVDAGDLAELAEARGGGR